MTDIVERLRYGTQQRNHGALVELCNEAAAAIERLRAACQAVVDTCHGAGAEHWAACEQCRAALEPKPDLRALLPELAIIRQVMKDPKP
jgi:hypothetical protein